MSLKYPHIKSVVPQEVLLGCSRIFEQGITGRGHWKKDFDRDYITQSSFPTLLIFEQCGGQFLFLFFSAIPACHTRQHSPQRPRSNVSTQP